jgi:hypothetical protein
MGDPVSEGVYRPHQILDLLPGFAVLKVRESDVYRGAPKIAVIGAKQVRPEIECQRSNDLASGRLLAGSPDLPS